MGWCHEFGPDINDTCDHPMTAGSSHCYCEVCGVICEGRFAGCAEVWVRGPKDVSLIRPRVRDVTHVEMSPLEPVDVDFTGASDLDDLLSSSVAGSDDASTNHRAPRSALPDVMPSEAVVDDSVITALVERIGAHVDERVRTALEEYRGELERVQPQALVIDAGDPSHLADVTASVEAGCRVLLTALDDATDQLRTSLSDIRGLAVELRDGLQNEAGAALKDSVGDIQQITAELRQELAQLAAFRRALSDGYPAVARAVEHASVKAATRFAELTRTISDLAPAALDQPNGHTTAGPADAEGADPTQWS